MTIASTCRNILLIALSTLFAIATESSVEAAEEVTVRLNDGKKMVAELHPRTNTEHLWLKFGDEGTVILRSITWQRIDVATIEDSEVSAVELQQLASQQGAQVDSSQTRFIPTLNSASHAEQARELLAFARRVNAVDFDARLANWDRDVEFDGIVIRLFPLDANGQATFVRGTLYAELVAGRRTDFNDAPSSRGLVPRQLAKWTVQVTQSQITDDGAIVKLPFQASHPEFDTKWAAHGLVHVRFVVPGHGVFEHSFDGVRVRPFAPLRDEMQRQGMQRFLPSESTSVNKRAE